MQRSIRPLARSEDLLVEELENETLVYDLHRHRAHCLNETAAFVFRHCDGQTSVAQLATRLSEDFGGPKDENVVWLALKQLDSAHLLNEPLPIEKKTRNYSRRMLAKKLATAGVILPVVTSIVVPLAAQGASRISPGDCWSNPSENAGKCCTNSRTCTATRFGVGVCLGPAC